jgi:hypothetical protein
LFCLRELDAEIAAQRVEGTYGGWSLGNALRQQEEDEHDAAAPDEMVYLGGDYVVPFSVDPLAWQKHWGEFQRVAFREARRENLEYFIKFDIANFYDSVRLDLLERKLRAVVASDKGGVIDLLFVLLRNWNRQFEGYGPKSVGLPQEEAGDCSRIMANLYLQQYDRLMRSACKEAIGEGIYLRYADDQIIMCQEKQEAQRLLFNASLELHKIGLNINSGKVIEFTCREDFNHYWCFHFFDLLHDDASAIEINEAAKLYLIQLQNERTGVDKRPWRSFPVLKRLCSLGINFIEEPWRKEIVALLLDREAIALTEAWMFARISRAVSAVERQELFDTIQLWIPSIPFNSFHFNVLRFFKENVPGQDLTEIRERIKDLRYN